MTREQEPGVPRCDGCGEELPAAYALTTCPKCADAFARIREYAEAVGSSNPVPLAANTWDDAFASFDAALTKRLSDLEARIPPANARPTVYRGDVLLTLGHEIAIAGQQLRDLTAFRDRVVGAAKDPAAWMLLRQELAS